MLLLFSNIDIHSEKLKKMWDALFEESSIRRAYWLFYSDKSKSKMKKLILKFEKIEKPPIDEVCLKRFEKDVSYDIIKKEEFKEDIYWDNIYEQFYEIILQDKNIENIYCSDHVDLLYEYGYEEEEDLKKIYKEKDEKERRNFIKNSMDNDFKYLYLFCTEEIRNKLNKIILKQLKFSKYCDTTQDEIYKKYEDEIEIKNKLYDNYRINEVLKDKRIKNMDEILKFIFDRQIGNKLLIITFFTKKKIEEEKFINELEENYGIYLDVDAFIKEMKQKLDEIQSLTQMNNYIGSDFGKGKSDLDIIIQSYEKAKIKGYLHDPCEQSEFSANQNSRVGNIKQKGVRGSYIGGRGGRGRGNNLGH